MFVIDHYHEMIVLADQGPLKEKRLAIGNNHNEGSKTNKH